jgi:hypothetical protein
MKRWDASLAIDRRNPFCRITYSSGAIRPVASTMTSAPVAYPVESPKGRLSTMEKSLVGPPWHGVPPGVEVKLLAEDDDLYPLAQSRAHKERAMLKRLKWLWARLAKLAHMDLCRESLLMKLGAGALANPPKPQPAHQSGVTSVLPLGDSLPVDPLGARPDSVWTW